MSGQGAIRQPKSRLMRQTLRNGESAMRAYIGAAVAVAVLAGCGGSGGEGGARSPGAASPAAVASTNASPRAAAAAGLAPSCRPDQLAADYRGGGYATQAVFGSIVIRDRSSRPCRISGRISVTPESRRGSVVHLVRPLVWRAPSTTLSADGRGWSAGKAQPANERVLILGLEGWQVDQTSGGNAPCRPVQPATWRIAVASVGALSIPNDEPDLAGQQGVARSLFGCRGHILAEGFLPAMR